MHVAPPRTFLSPSIALLTVALCAGSARADQLWVDASAAPGGDGSQAAPYTDLQTAVDHAAGGTAPHTIRVAPGDYAGFTTPAGLGQTQVWALGWTLEATVGPIVAGDGGLVLRALTLDGQGGVALQASAGYALVDQCIVRNASIGIEGSFVSVWNTDVVQCGVGVKASVDMTDAILFDNGLDLEGTFQGTSCSNIWQSWLHPVNGLSTQTIDPKFWDLEQGDLHLRPGSPATSGGCWTNYIGPFPFDAGYAPQPVVYCTAKTATDGCTAQIGWTGTHKVSLATPGAFVVTAGNVMPNQNGVLFYNTAPANLPILGGTVCVLPPTTRVGGQNSGSSGAPCSGAFSFDFAAYMQASPVFPIEPGNWVYAQWWFRDTANSFGSALSDAIRFAVIH